MTTDVLPEPILANMNTYAVLVKTPEGNFLNIPPGGRAAVAGPGFEDYVEKRVLTRVGVESFRGSILYETPLTLRPAPFSAPEPVPAPRTPPEEPSGHGVTMRLEDEGEIVSMEGLEVTGTPVTAPPEPSEGPPPALQNLSLPEKLKPGMRVAMPSAPKLRAMLYKDLVMLARRCNFEMEGASRTAVITKLLPLCPK